jgi:predicted small secreted protein
MKKLNFKRITLVVIAVLFGAVVLTSLARVE